MAELITVDPQLAAIVTQGDRDTRARGDFNSAITTALDALVAAEDTGGT
ncbi:MAG: hypothetical protein ACK51S_01900 [Alphaproteobacteria bacterium]|jgi:hypothetical protein